MSALHMLPEDEPWPGSTTWVYATGTGWTLVSEGDWQVGPKDPDLDSESGGSGRAWDSRDRAKETGMGISTPFKK